MCHWIILKLCPLWCILTLCPVIITNQKWLKICLRNDLYCVQWGIKTHAHSLMVKNYWKIKYCQPSLWFASVSCKQQVVWWQATSGLVQSADGTALEANSSKMLKSPLTGSCYYNAPVCKLPAIMQRIQELTQPLTYLCKVLTHSH